MADELLNDLPLVILQRFYVRERWRRSSRNRILDRAYFGADPVVRSDGRADGRVIAATG